MEQIFYLAQAFGTIHNIGCTIASLSGLVLVVATIGIFANDTKDGSELCKKISRRMAAIVSISLLFCAFMPRRETYLLMAGGRVIDMAAADSPEIKELPENTLNLLNEYIKQSTERIRDARENKSQKK